MGRSMPSKEDEDAAAALEAALEAEADTLATAINELWPVVSASARAGAEEAYMRG